MKNLLIGLVLVAMVGCISTNLTRKENLETNLANAEVILAVAGMANRVMISIIIIFFIMVPPLRL